MNTIQRIQYAAELLAESRRIVSLTGAGISTPSGIPDFRSPQTGLWEHADVTVVASIWGFRSNPQAFYDWISPLATSISTASPNPAHLALAEMESMGMMRAVITQNIDGLHQRAGSQRVLELHGNLNDMHCPACEHTEPMASQVDDLSIPHKIPRCRICGEALKPTIVLYGEMLPYDVLMDAQTEARLCKAMIIAGSSLEVTPACDLPVVAHSTGAKIILVNNEPTPLDDLADVIIRDDVATVLPAIVDGIRATLQ